MRSDSGARCNTRTATAPVYPSIARRCSLQCKVMKTLVAIVASMAAVLVGAFTFCTAEAIAEQKGVRNASQPVANSRFSNADSVSSTTTGATGHEVLAIRPCHLELPAASPFSTGARNRAVALATVTPNILADSVLGLGPIGYWPLDETTGNLAHDRWAGRDGVANAGVTLGIVGPRSSGFKGFASDNTAFEFNGTTGAVEIPPLNLNKAALTIVAWMKPAGSQANYAGIVFCRGGKTAAGLNYRDSGQLGYHWNDAPNTYNWSSRLYPADGAWNFVALVVEPSKATIYLDDLKGFGVQSAVNKVTHNAEEFDGALFVGADYTAGRFFNGGIDDVVVFDRPLTETEIRAIRDAGLNGTYLFTPVRIIEQPQDQTIMAGTSLALSAKAVGTLPLTFQWKKDGQDLPGATADSLVLGSTSVSDTGIYQLLVTQGATTVATLPVTLTVKSVPSYLELPDGLVLHLKFDGDYQDSSGRNNHGTPRGAPQIVPGKIGAGALQYSTTVERGAVASSNYVSLGTPADLDFGPGESFSVAFWVKFTGSPGDLPFIANNNFSLGDVGVTIAPSYNEGGWSWGLNDVIDPRPWPGIAISDPIQKTLNDGNWHHLMHVFDRTGDAVTWLDGVKVSSISISAAADWDFRTGTEWAVGQAGGSYAEEGVFTLDDLGIWRRPLSDYEAQAIYFVGQNHGRSFDSTVPFDPGLAIRLTTDAVVVNWETGTLESAPALSGQWSPVLGANPPALVVKAAGGTRFYRVRR